MEPLSFHIAVDGSLGGMLLVVGRLVQVDWTTAASCVWNSVHGTLPIHFDEQRTIKRAEM